ncbi:MAG: flippase-like domain-containing protein, partial [Cyanobacteria bacterium REEB67]|nr:flippase-like domain-containing protein [Cyanobacteria bacterium REEB67]
MVSNGSSGSTLVEPDQKTMPDHLTDRNSSRVSEQYRDAALVAQAQASPFEALFQSHPILGEIVARLKQIKISKSTKLRLKIGVSVVMFVSLFLFGKVDLSKCIQVALTANRWFLGVALCVFLSSTFLNAHRWQLLAQAVGLQKSLLKLTQLCFVGLFFNLFLPSTVGGDVSRCYYLSKGTGKHMNAFYSVLADRTVGIAVLFLFATVGILVGPGGSGLAWQL